MGIAAMPGNDEQGIAGHHVAKDVAVGKHRAEHQRPRDDSRAGHRFHRKHAVAAAKRLPDQRPRNTVCDRVHSLVFPNYFTRRSGGRFLMTTPTRRAATPRRSIAARAASAASGAIATSSPPEVCGSKSRSRYSGGTPGSNSTHSATNSRLLLKPPGKCPSLAAAKAPGK